MEPLSLNPEQPDKPELPLADLEFLRSMESRAAELADELVASRAVVDRVEQRLAQVGIARELANPAPKGESMGFTVPNCERRRITISAIVGDSRKRQDLAPYRALVSFKAGRFRAARARARRCVRCSGEWPLSASLFSLTVSGECAILWLRVAGWLRACRVVEVVDVTGHAATLDGISARLEAIPC